MCIGEEEEEEAAQAQVPSPGPVDLGMTTAGCGVGSACRGQNGGNGEPVICGDTVETRSVGERVQFGTRGEDLPPLPSVEDEAVLPGGRELAYVRTCFSCLSCWWFRGSPWGREEIGLGWE